MFKKVRRAAQGLAEDVRYYGKWMRDEAEKRIGNLYPKVEITTQMAKERTDLKPYVGKKLNVIAWLWARTVKSPNPAFAHVDIPLFDYSRRPLNEQKAPARNERNRRLNDPPRPRVAVPPSLDDKLLAQLVAAEGSYVSAEPCTFKSIPFCSDVSLKKSQRARWRLLHQKFLSVTVTIRLSMRNTS
jgi:hypothetical protein